MPHRSGSDVTPTDLPADTAVAVVFFRPSPEQVERVVRHELGHHFGFDEKGVRNLGL